MNLTQSLARLKEADQICNAKLLYREFQADSEMRDFITFGRNLLGAIAVCVLYWGLIVTIMAGLR